MLSRDRARPVLALERVRARRAEDRAAARQDPARGLDRELLVLVLQRPAPAVAEAHDRVAVLVDALPDDRADDRVEAGAVAPACENSEAHAANLAGARQNDARDRGVAPSRRHCSLARYSRRARWVPGRRASPRPGVEGALTIYSSLPKHGDSAPASPRSRPASAWPCANAGSRAAGQAHPVRRTRLLDARRPHLGSRRRRAERQPRRRRPERDRLPRRARATAARAVSLPVTNEAGILQISPFDTLTNLTRCRPGGPRTGPERYYPSGERTFARLSPTTCCRPRRCSRAARDRRGAPRGRPRPRLYGRELGAQLIARARRDGPAGRRARSTTARSEDIPDLAARARRGEPGRDRLRGHRRAAAPGGCSRRSTARCPACQLYATGGMLARDPRRPFPVAPQRGRSARPVAPASRMPRDGGASCARSRARRRRARTARGALRLRGDAARARRASARRAATGAGWSQAALRDPHARRRDRQLRATRQGDVGTIVRDLRAARRALRSRLVQ